MRVVGGARLARMHSRFGTGRARRRARKRLCDVTSNDASGPGGHITSLSDLFPFLDVLPFLAPPRTGP